ncbi:hypothetical protein DSO57_1035167 [Entomophthora muscae]|uniref:Uncharacterized protein n=1 Tax=Entomophthora muscae TaxID=34485 RepID=A0ACC2ULJ2_9FUNG|nr:hypothetical protein DSO57_1035167 [Entomophthora muscae]
MKLNATKQPKAHPCMRMPNFPAFENWPPINSTDIKKYCLFRIYWIRSSLAKRLVAFYPNPRSIWRRSGYASATRPIRHPPAPPVEPLDWSDPFHSPKPPLETDTIDPNRPPLTRCSHLPYLGNPRIQSFP